MNSAVKYQAFANMPCRSSMRWFVTVVCVLLSSAAVADAGRQVLVRDIVEIQGVRDNQLVGYGIVVGLKGTGDRQQTYFTTQTLANALQRVGVQMPSPLIVRVANVAAVFVTASLPPFARPGMKLDVTVSSIGDAKSLEGGVLILTSLRGPDGQVYADAQGPLTLGGYSAGNGGNLKTVNHTTVGRVPEGAIVERDTSVDLRRLRSISLTLRSPDFTAAGDIADGINREFHRNIATAMDSRRIDVDVAASGLSSIPSLISKVQSVAISFHPPAKVVVNERTGTIVMGGDVKLSAVSILHGNLTIEVATKYAVSQPEPFSNTGRTKVVPDIQVQANETPASAIRLEEGASVEELINGLHTVGATPRDIVSILQAIKSAGGLEADLEVL
jgi:flagellar P-ring protein precursor FlgI